MFSKARSVSNAVLKDSMSISASFVVTVYCIEVSCCRERKTLLAEVVCAIGVEVVHASVSRCCPGVPHARTHCCGN